MNLRIKKLDKFIAKQFLLLFAGTFFICLFVLMMQFLWRFIDELIGKGLSMEVLAQFFEYMALMMVPQALPLAILLSSLITFGNLGESSELTAIKAAGISLMQSFRSLIVITVAIMAVSFYFQNNIGPNANMKLMQLLVSMKQKSPELEIPEGIFYDGLPNCNIYVQKKNIKTGKLYGIMIYRMTDSYEDAAIILADSGMIQSTAEKKHLLLSLWSGEWFENMRESDLGGSAAVPYRRETFTDKKVLLDFDNNFSLMDAAALSNNAAGKSLSQIRFAIDSLNATYDSIGRAFWNDTKQMCFPSPRISKKDSLGQVRAAQTGKIDIDKRLRKMKIDRQQMVYSAALSSVQRETSDLDFKSMMTQNNERVIRNHELEAQNKYALALQCIIFFFIGAPLGAIIRKGGLGMPIIISVLVFIVYYILDNSAFRMSRQGSWPIWIGHWLAIAIMSPLAVFVTYKAMNDSMVFNADGWKRFFTRLLGLRAKRSIQGKEVVIEPPHYKQDNETLLQINGEVMEYSRRHNLKSLPNFIKVFFKYEEDHDIEAISDKLEKVIRDLSNTRDKQVMHLINRYPVLAVKAHTRPFDRRWMNIVAAIIVPVGIFTYLRMWRFRLRLLRDLKVIRYTNTNIVNYTEKRMGHLDGEEK
ncbi:MAG: LptF/LptG family permease [Prevotella sp.]|nr:LptF/LptG family permease [Prevotella sp.]MDD7189436.1 LptF/LptG family permease [Prevotella sp.]MDY5313649.1 LptF/LptG family permease [Prevotella sp.]